MENSVSRLAALMRAVSRYVRPGLRGMSELTKFGTRTWPLGLFTVPRPSMRTDCLPSQHTSRSASAFESLGRTCHRQSDGKAPGVPASKLGLGARFGPTVSFTPDWPVSMVRPACQYRL